VDFGNVVFRIIFKFSSGGKTPKIIANRLLAHQKPTFFINLFIFVKVSTFSCAKLRFYAPKTTTKTQFHKEFRANVTLWPFSAFLIVII